MPEKMKMEHKSKYLHVEVSGVFNFQRAKDFFDTIVAECTKREQSKVLIDGRKMEGELSILYLYDLGKYLARVRTQAISFAIVGTEEVLLPDRFLETVASNLGAIVLVTTDIDKALQWLGVSDRSACTDK